MKIHKFRTLRTIAIAFAFLSSFRSNANGAITGGEYSRSAEEWVVDFLTTNTVTAPVIRSQWFVDKSEAPKNEILSMLEVRRFGLLLLRKCDALAPGVIATTNLAASEKQAETLLALADWVGGTEGYGNALIAARIHDIATVAIGQLAVNTNFPIDSIVFLTARLDAPWYSPAVRARILDNELGENYFYAHLSDADPEKALQKAWTRGVSRPAIKDGSFPKDMLKMWPTNNLVNNNLLDRHPTFFIDNEHPGAKTSSESWSLKWHEKFVNGLDSNNLRGIKAVVRFRERVGCFPSDVPYKYKTPIFNSLTKAAFEYAWRPYRKKEGAIYGIAAKTYEMIQDGEFLDQDTRIQHARAKETEEVQ